MTTSALALLLPLLHAGGPPAPEGHWTHWRLEPTVAVGLLVLAAAYWAWLGPLNRRRPDATARPVTGRQVACFAGGWLTLLVALGPPLDDWSDYFLLSAHMVQHLLLTLLAAPLLLLGTPGWVLEPLLRRRALARAGYALTRAPVALLVSGLALAVWHVPALYAAALRSAPLHGLEHLVFLLTALLAWWPLVGPLEAWPRLSPPMQCLYLFGQTIPAGVVGALITMADPGLYPPYGDVVRRPGGLDVATDQQIGGLLMWVGGNTIYLLLITVVFLSWASREEAADRERPSPGRRPSVTGAR